MSSSKTKTYDPDWIRHTTSYAQHAERQLLFESGKNKSKDKSLQRNLNKFNTTVNQMAPEQIDDELKIRKLPTTGDIDIRRARLKHHYKYQSIYKRDDLFTRIEQNFQYIAVIDFEATCEENEKNYRHEIIEFPIVLIDVEKQTIVDEFQSYCRPVFRPILSEFCKELTGIKQSQVDVAPTFVEVFEKVEKWLNDRNLLSTENKGRFALAADNPSDFAHFLRIQCHFSSIPYPRWAKKWIDIRKEFSNFYSVKRCGLMKMLTKLNFTFEGHRHSGIDDAFNIARIAIQLLKDGSILLFNDSIRASDPKFLAVIGQDDPNQEDDQIDDDDQNEEDAQDEEDDVVFNE